MSLETPALQQVPEEIRELFQTIASTRSDILKSKEKRLALAKVCDADDIAEWDRSIKEVESALAGLERLVESSRLDMQFNKGKIKAGTRLMWAMKDSKNLVAATNNRLLLAHNRMLSSSLTAQMRQGRQQSDGRQNNQFMVDDAPPPYVAHHEPTKRAIAERRKEDKERIARSASVSTLAILEPSSYTFDTDPTHDPTTHAPNTPRAPLQHGFDDPNQTTATFPDARQQSDHAVVRPFTRSHMPTRSVSVVSEYTIQNEPLGLHAFSSTRPMHSRGSVRSISLPATLEEVSRPSYQAYHRTVVEPAPTVVSPTSPFNRRESNVPMPVLSELEDTTVTSPTSIPSPTRVQQNEAVRSYPPSDNSRSATPQQMIRRKPTRPESVFGRPPPQPASQPVPGPRPAPGPVPVPTLEPDRTPAQRIPDPVPYQSYKYPPTSYQPPSGRTVTPYPLNQRPPPPAPPPAPPALPALRPPYPSSIHDNAVRPPIPQNRPPPPPVPTSHPPSHSLGPDPDLPPGLSHSLASTASSNATTYSENGVAKSQRTFAGHRHPVQVRWQPSPDKGASGSGGASGDASGYGDGSLSLVRSSGVPSGSSTNTTRPTSYDDRVYRSYRPPGGLG